jgi:DNA-binding PadR family transcriptional regulator
MQSQRALQPELFSPMPGAKPKLFHAANGKSLRYWPLRQYERDGCAPKITRVELHDGVLVDVTRQCTGIRGNPRLYTHVLGHGPVQNRNLRTMLSQLALIDEARELSESIEKKAREIATESKHQADLLRRASDLSAENFNELKRENARLHDELDALRRCRPELLALEGGQRDDVENFQSAVLIIRPELERIVGHRPAIVLQQLSWLLAQERNGVMLGDRKYIYNTYPQWRSTYFQNWSVRTIRRVFSSLETAGFVDSKQPEGRVSRRKYYTLSAEGAKLTSSARAERPKRPLPTGQIDPGNGAKRPLPTSTKNENSSKRLLAPAGEQELLAVIGSLLGAAEMRKNGGMWRKRIRGGTREVRALRNTIEDFKNRASNQSDPIHHPAKWFTDHYVRKLVESDNAEVNSAA